MHFLYVLNESSVQLRKSESTYLARLKNKYVSDMDLETPPHISAPISGITFLEADPDEGSNAESLIIKEFIFYNTTTLSLA